MAAALLGALGSYDALAIARPTFCKTGKPDQFGVDFKLKIIAANCTAPPHRKITGKVVVETSFPIKHEGILIQFEAICTLKYATEHHMYDDVVILHEGRHHILENTKEMNGYGYQESPIRHVILTGNLYDWVNHTLDTGTITYPPFTMEIPDNLQLPATFKNSFGNLIYRLAVYMKPINGVFVEVGEKVITQAFTCGHHNLFYNAASIKSISLESFCKKSVFFSSKKLVEVLFSVGNSGYLPGESISYTLQVKNPQCIGLQLKVELYKQIRYEANKKKSASKVNKFYIIACKEKNEAKTTPELSWEEVLDVPVNQEPSYSGHFVYNVSYFIQFTVRVTGHGSVKGKAPIFIGTSRNSAQMANLLSVPIRALRRLGLASSGQSIIRKSTSATTTLSLPPAYSQLSSRISSVETLPPAYEEIESLHIAKMGASSHVPNLCSSFARQDTVIIEEEAEVQSKCA